MVNAGEDGLPLSYAKAIDEKSSLKLSPGEESILKRLNSPKEIEEAGDILHRLWQESTTYPARFKPVQLYGSSVSNLPEYLMKNKIPKEYHQFYSLDHNGKVIEDITKIPNKYLAANNQAANIAGAKSYLDSIKKFQGQRFASPADADTFLRAELQNIHSNWLKENPWAVGTYAAKWEDLPPDLQLTNLYPLKKMFEKYSLDNPELKNLSDQTFSSLEKSIKNTQKAIGDVESKIEVSRYKDLDKGDVVDGFIKLSDASGSKFNPEASHYSKDYFRGRLEDAKTGKIVPPKPGSGAKELDTYYDQVFREAIFKQSDFPGKNVADLQLIAPGTPPGSGARVYLIKDNATKSIVGAYKIQVKGGLDEILSSVAAERIISERSPSTNLAKNIAYGRIADRDEFFVLQSAAAGSDLDGIISKSAQPKVDAAIDSAAKIFSDFHVESRGKSALSGSEKAVFRDNALYEVRSFDSNVIGDYKKSPGSVAGLLDSGELSAKQASEIKKKMESVSRGYQEVITKNPELLNPTLTHGDAHGGNIFIDQNNKGTLIDYGTSLWSVSTRAGNAVGDPGNDVGRMVGHLVT